MEMILMVEMHIYGINVKIAEKYIKIEKLFIFHYKNMVFALNMQEKFVEIYCKLLQYYLQLFKWIHADAINNYFIYEIFRKFGGKI